MIGKHKIVFLTFSDSRFDSWKRLKKEAERFGVFDEIVAGDERMFESWYRNKYKDRFKERGYGYWQWKPYLIRRILDRMDEGDILFYSDGGNSLNKDAITRFIEYAYTCVVSISGIVVFEQDMQAKEWTKSDVFKYFGVLNNEEYLFGGQINSGVFFLRKCSNACSFIDEWYYILHNQHWLSTDEPSRIPNSPYFKENRHDQSIADVLSRKYNAIRLPYSEIYRIDEDWTKMKDYPIWQTRYRERKCALYMKFKSIIKILSI